MPHPRITYANVVSTLALFLALGGVGWAATTLPKNSVGAAQIKKNAVTTSKIKNGALGAADLSSAAKESLRGATGPQGAQGPAGTPNGYTRTEADARFSVRADQLSGRLVTPLNSTAGTVLTIPGVASITPLNCQSGGANATISNLGSGTDGFSENPATYVGTNWAAFNTPFATTSARHVLLSAVDGSRTVDVYAYAAVSGSTCVYEAVALSRTA